MEAGRVLKDRYRLTERIAVGGMGEVWRAEDVMLHRTVAIKILHPALAADPQFQQRFIQEARTLASLNATGLIDLYDACEETGPDGGKLSYLVMELVDARPLSAILATDGVLPSHRLLPIMAQCASALSAAHGAGIVHRDIKPANILVAADGAVTLIDFGIARRPGDSSLTAAGTVIGTVEYASPEQLRGETLTGASDIYALGVVGYECLTGAPPFFGDPAAVIAAQLNQDPPPLGADVPPATADVVTRALAKDPADRFGSAAELAGACRAAGSGTRVMPAGRARPPIPPTAAVEYDETPEPESVDRLLRRRTLTTSAITLGVIVLIALIAGVVWFAVRDGGDEAAGDKTSEPTSTSVSPSPTGPDEPAESTLVNAAADKCVGMDYGIFTDAVVMTDCGGATTEFEYVASPSDDDIFKIVNDSDGEKACVNWTYGDTEAAVGECGFDVAWKFRWIETTDGFDVWQIHSVTNSEYCLAADAEYPVGEDCTADDSQYWKTEAVEG